MTNNRTTGIECIGSVPWGTHFCEFHSTREELADTLVPYFAAGLQQDEFCLWVTSDPSGVEGAKVGLRKQRRIWTGISIWDRLRSGIATTGTCGRTLRCGPGIRTMGGKGTSRVLPQHRMIGLCTYPLDGADGVLESCSQSSIRSGANRGGMGDD